MAKLLIEYKGIPAIIDHNLSDVNTIKYVVVYKTESNTFLKKDFKTVDAALDFDADGKTKLVFVYIRSKPDADNLVYTFYRHIEFVNNKFFITSTVENTNFGYKATISFGFETFKIRKTKAYGVPEIFYDILYSRRRTIVKDTKKSFELVESFYELVPRYEDIFLETIFLYDIITSNMNVNEQSEIEAYFLQAKARIDNKQVPPKNKPDDLESQPKLSDELLTLEGLIGLDKIKLEVQELKALANFRQKR